MGRILRLALGVSLLGVVSSCTALLGDFSTSSEATSEGGADTGGGASDSATDTVSPVEGGPDGAPDVVVDGGGAGGDAGDGSQGEAGGSLSCAVVAAEQRLLNGDGGSPIALQSLRVYNASQTNVLALAKMSAPPDLAFSFRSDRPGQAPQVVQMQGPPPSGGPARMLTSSRSVANDTTYVLASDDTNAQALLYTWPDNQGIGANPSTGAESNGFQTGSMVSTASNGNFYAIDTASQGVYVDLETPPTTPQLTTQILATSFTGIGDGQPLYRLSDDSVSIVYPSSGQMQQGQYAAGSKVATMTRTYYPSQMLPISFLADGTNVDIAAVEMSDAGTFSLVTGVVPESQLFTFDPATALKPMPMILQANPNACLAAYPGKLIALLPQTAGMDLYVFDVATQKVTYSLTGASNLVHGDTAIVSCAMATAAVTAQGVSLDVVWADNAGGSGLQNLVFAPVQCTVQ